MASLASSSASFGGLATSCRFFPISRDELSLPAVLKCGQAFRWTERKVAFARREEEKVKREDAIYGVKAEQEVVKEVEEEVTEWCMGWKDRTIVLRQDDAGIHYRALFPATPVGTTAHALDEATDTTLPLLRDYFWLDSARLQDLYADWSKRDPRFHKVIHSAQGERLKGLRVCKQDEWEALVAFICSSNNNISRITLMLSRLCEAYGTLLPSPPPGFTLTSQPSLDPTVSTPLAVYSFPTPATLSDDSVTQRLRELGFGYRAGYVASTAQMICRITADAAGLGSWPVGNDGDADEKEECKFDLVTGETLDPCAYLRHLGRLPYERAHPRLMQFAGVGPKVADCVALFGLGIKDVVPVDVHVFQIAQRTYQLRGLPSSGAPSKAHYAKVQTFFRNLWGEWAGWAQQVVFAAELRGFQVAEPRSKKEEVDAVKPNAAELALATPSPRKRKSTANTPSTPSAPGSPADSFVDTLSTRRSKRACTAKVEVKQAKIVTPPPLPTLATVPLSASTVDGEKKVAGNRDGAILTAAEQVKRRRTRAA